MRNHGTVTWDTNPIANPCGTAQRWATEAHQGRELPESVRHWVAGRLERHWKGMCNCPKKARNLP